MTNLPKEGEEIPDKELVSLGANENKTPATSSEGEYSEEKKRVISAMKGHYGDEAISPDDSEYTVKLEKMVASDLLPKAGKLKSYDEANTRIIAMMEDEPELSSIMTEVGQGRKFLSSVKSHLDIANLPEDDDSDMAAWENNAKMRESRYNEKLRRQEEIASNEEKSMATLEEFISEKGLDDTGKIKFGELIGDFLDRAYSGDITKQFLEVMYYYMNRDTELAKASELGEIRGKNAKIEKTKFAEEDYAGDGLPDINSGGGLTTDGTPKEELDPIIASLNRHLDQGSVLGNR